MNGWLWRSLLAIGFVLALLYFGQWLARLGTNDLPLWAQAPVALPNWLQFDVSYVNSLGGNIGSGGLDALIVGWIAGGIMARMDRGSAAKRQRAALRRQLRLKRPVSLTTEFATGAPRLPLAGFVFGTTDIADCTVTAARFHDYAPTRRPGWLHAIARLRATRRSISATLTEVSFLGCEILATRFGDAHGGATLTRCTFDRCEIKRCDFRSALFSNTKDPPLFADTLLQRCNFDGATFVGTDLSRATIRWCSFWGATFDDAQPPLSLFDALREADCIRSDPTRQGVYTVLRWREFITRPTRARLRFVGKMLLGGRFLADKTD